MCELAHCRAGAERLESVCPSFYARLFDADVSIRLHSKYCLWYGLAQNSQSRLTPDYSKKLKPSNMLIAPTWISQEGLSQGTFITCSVFWILDQSDGPMFQHPEDPSSKNLWHAIDIGQICLNLTKAYTNFSSNDSEVSPSVAHDQIVHSFVGGLFWPPRIPNAIPTPSNLSSPFFTQCF
jgi:hypothetical protein